MPEDLSLILGADPQGEAVAQAMKLANRHGPVPVAPATRP